MAARILKRILLPHMPISLVSFSSSSASPPPSDLIPTIVTLLAHHRSKSRWTHLRSLLSSPTATQLTPSQISQIALHLKPKPHLALRFFYFTLSHPSLFSHDLSSFSTLTHLLSRARLKSHARDVIRVALRSSDSLNYVDPVMKFFELLVKSYRECDSAPFVFDLLIRTCLELRKIDQSIEIVRKLSSRGTSPQVATCNCLVSWVVRCRGCHEGYGVFEEVFGLGEEEMAGDRKRIFRVRPNVHSFNALMEGFHRDGEVGMVEKVWREMGRYRCDANGYSYSILMAAFSGGDRMREVESLWEEMKIKGIEPDVVGYNTVIGAFCEVGEVEKAEEVFREMGLKGVEVTCVTLEHLVRGHCEVGNVDSALLVYKDMCRRAFRPKASTMDVLIEALCGKNRSSEGMDIMKGAIKDVSFSLSRKSYELLITGLCKEGKMEEALKLQAEMVGKGHEPDLKLYDAFIQGYVELGNEEMAAMLQKEMSATQMLPDIS